MTAELMCRAKSQIKDEGWLYGQVRCYAIQCSDAGCEEVWGIKADNGYYHPIDTKTICMQTPYKDCFGKDIFEGDIVRVVEGCERNYTVKAVKPNKFVMVDTNNIKLREFDSTTVIEVIGNAFDD